MAFTLISCKDPAPTLVEAYGVWAFDGAYRWPIHEKDQMNFGLFMGQYVAGPKNEPFRNLTAAQIKRIPLLPGHPEFDGF